MTEGTDILAALVLVMLRRGPTELALREIADLRRMSLSARLEPPPTLF